MFSGSPKGRIQGPQDFVGVGVAGSQLGLRDLGFCGANLGGGLEFRLVCLAHVVPLTPVFARFDMSPACFS